MIPDDRIVYFHVSSKVSSPKTNASRFADYLFASLAELKALHVAFKSNGVAG